MSGQKNCDIFSTSQRLYASQKALSSCRIVWVSDSFSLWANSDRERVNNNATQNFTQECILIWSSPVRPDTNGDCYWFRTSGGWSTKAPRGEGSVAHALRR